ncbi:MAG: signal peptidase I [Acidobacteria bacterium]|nr:signal peptidase I [Acidobacteriota bacterium]MBV9475907.1 signal peptidase I [Acidobacteriota bacterium]
MAIDKKKVLYEIRVFALMILIVSSLRSALADWNDVPTGSMKPTIQEGDRVVVNKLAYDLKVPFTTIEITKWADPHRGDIVVLFSPVDGTRLVKRVAALPGDQVELRDNQLFINGHLAKQSPIAIVGAGDYGSAYVNDEDLDGHIHKVMLTPEIPAVRNYGPLTVPKGSYFVLGDNRDNSNDSRFIGFIERRRIVGKAVAVAFSLDRSHWYVPRLDRFFEGLH